jgi:hypothetical protein
MFRFTTTTDAKGEKTKNVEVSNLAGWLTIGIALIAALAPIITSIYTGCMVTNPNNEAVQRLEKQKFQSELLQKALQMEKSQDREKSLRILKDLKLLGDPDPKIEEFLKNPDTIPQWPSASSERKAPSSASGGEKSSTPK